MTDTTPIEVDSTWRRFAGPLSALVGLVGVLVLVAVVTTLAFSADDADDTASGYADRVAPDYEAPLFSVNVFLTADGIEPDILYLPAGRKIRLLIQNRDELEHHFRIIGMDTLHLRWLRTPVLSEDEIEYLSEEELAAYGIVDIATLTDQAEIEHVLHHLNPWFERNRDESPSGIKPLGTEVHGWVIRGTNDLMEFFAPVPGEYVAEDVRFPEFTARVIVFDPNGA